MEKLFNEIITNCKSSYHLKNYLPSIPFSDGNIYVIAFGKAAYHMALQAYEVLGDKITKGIVLTKYNHALSQINKFDIYEAAHPVLDQNGIDATEKILQLTGHLNSNDTVICLISGGGSALFENPIIPLEKLQTINQQLLKSSATINEINVIRKHLSKVKGGKFAKWCYPAKVYSYIISDVLGNDLSSIASGPTVIDTTTNEMAYAIAEKYGLPELNFVETIKDLDNSFTTIIGDINLLIKASSECLKQRGLQVEIVTNNLTGEVKQVSESIVNFALEHQNITKSTAYLFAGEITVEVKGNGLGGRNQELVCRCIEGIKNLKNTTVISFSSDGTDGPTDATGGFVNDQTYKKVNDLNKYLDNNDCYHLLKKIDQLIISGPTNTNINDITLVFIER